jgi:hypothetical protein
MYDNFMQFIDQPVLTTQQEDGSYLVTLLVRKQVSPGSVITFVFKDGQIISADE